jgi:hypothetical protein
MSRLGLIVAYTICAGEGFNYAYMLSIMRSDPKSEYFSRDPKKTFNNKSRENVSRKPLYVPRRFGNGGYAGHARRGYEAMRQVGRNNRRAH